MSLYPPPQDLKTSVFTTVPETFSDCERRSDWIDANKPGQKVPSFLEGASFDRSGDLSSPIFRMVVSSEFRTKAIGVWSPTTMVLVFSQRWAGFDRRLQKWDYET